jgi:uncharacterized protein YhbP (UPF0306 family)
LSAFSNPAFYLFNINAQALFLTPGNRVKKAQTVNEAAISGLATIRHGDMIKGPLFTSAPG